MTQEAPRWCMELVDPHEGRLADGKGGHFCGLLLPCPVHSAAPVTDGGTTKMNDLEAMIEDQKVFFWRTQQPPGVAFKIGYGDGYAPQFTRPQWEQFKSEVDALFALFPTEETDGGRKE